LVPPLGHLPGGRKGETILQDDVQVLGDCLGQGELAKTLGPQDPGKIRQGDEGEKVIGRLNGVEVEEIM
jgi:hypothetical protein